MKRVDWNGAWTDWNVMMSDWNTALSDSTLMMTDWSATWSEWSMMLSNSNAAWSDWNRQRADWNVKMADHNALLSGWQGPRPNCYLGQVDCCCGMTGSFVLWAMRVGSLHFHGLLGNALGSGGAEPLFLKRTRRKAKRVLNVTAELLRSISWALSE